MIATAVILFGLLLLAVALAAYVVAVYNGLVGVRYQVDQAWANIDVLLKQRHDELPMLIEVVRGHAVYERELVEKVTALRARTGSGSPDADRLAAEQALSQGIGRLLAIAEAYPDLKVSASYLELQRRISGLEEQIAHRREFYNAAVNLNNVRREQFPGRLFADPAGLQQRPLFAAANEERAEMSVGALLRGLQPENG